VVRHLRLIARAIATRAGVRAPTLHRDRWVGGLCVVLAIAFASDGAATAAGSEGFREVRSLVKDRLGADRVTGRCRRSGVHCRWRARRQIDGWAFRCRGRAVRRGGGWRLGSCDWHAPRLAPVAKRPHPVRFGFNASWQSYPKKVSYAAEAGAEVIRFPFSWNLIEPSRGQRDWTVYDNLYKEATSLGIKLILTPADAPCWARPSLPCQAPPYVGWRPDQAFLGEFAEFVGAAVERYPDAVALEVWNEPNLHPFFDPAPNTAEYAAILRAGYIGSKAARPELPVLFGGLAGVEANQAGKSINYVRFLRAVNKLGGVPYYDAVALHYYSGVASGRRMLSRIKTELMRAGVPRRDLWLTETGYSVTQLGSERAQADALERTYDVMSRTPGLRSVVVHKMFDSSLAANTLSSDMGLVDAAGRPKLSFEMFASKLGNA